ncbi:hypothetical protein Leryth_008717 [Lithospermum erythrorhizon]|uniref:C2 domain-containing protein n=1 Tax=Lithospermum erythrorhizon TaxID=34254 RepID=A0AAV3NVX1_LITER|nr:hypothetical protein Leryth_008717 [Lithospermum erythrorhizon]
MGYAPFQLLELNIISAQDLAPVCKKLRTYAITYINPERKLRTRIDQNGQINPQWNDKFVFRVDDNFLNSDTSAVMIDIYALGWLKDVKVGSIRVLISNLIPPDVRVKGGSSKRFVALQIRRSSGRPQGILNMGVSLLDNTMRTMPLYIQLCGSSLGFQDLTDVKMYKQYANRRGSEEKLGAKKEDYGVKKIQLRRTNSDRTDLATKDKQKQPNGGSTILSEGGGASMVNCSIYNRSSVNGSVVNGSEMCASDIGPSPSVVAAAVARGLILTPLDVPRNPRSSIIGDFKAEESDIEGLQSKIDRWRTEPKPFEAFFNNNASTNHGKSLTKKPTPKHNRSHTLGGKPTPKHNRRHTVGADPGLFTCFGKAFGCEFTIVCGEKNGKSRRQKRVCDSELAGSSLLT